MKAWLLIREYLNINGHTWWEMNGVGWKDVTTALQNISARWWQVHFNSWISNKGQCFQKKAQPPSQILHWTPRQRLVNITFNQHTCNLLGGKRVFAWGVLQTEVERCKNQIKPVKKINRSVDTQPESLSLKLLLTQRVSCLYIQQVRQSRRVIIASSSGRQQSPIRREPQRC